MLPYYSFKSYCCNTKLPVFLPHQNLSKSHHLSSDAKDFVSAFKLLPYENNRNREATIKMFIA